MKHKDILAHFLTLSLIVILVNLDKSDLIGIGSGKRRGKYSIDSKVLSILKWKLKKRKLANQNLSFSRTIILR